MTFDRKLAEKVVKTYVPVPTDDYDEFLSEKDQKESALSNFACVMNMIGAKPEELVEKAHHILS